MCSEEIILEIEDTSLKCEKEILIQTSDYFKAMFEGNFVERDKERIKLEGVSLKGFNIILSLIQDELFLIENEDLLLVLQLACMLQFVQIKNLCVDKITELLSPRNCLEVWYVTERLNIKPLYVKAKAMALEEFLQIKENGYILELTLNQIYYYLGHIYLKTDSELTVFQTAIKWWYENSEQYLENKTQVLLKLLSCIDFECLPEDHLKEIMVYPDIASNIELTDILSHILLLRSRSYFEDSSKASQESARSLHKTRPRIAPLFPCLLANWIHSKDGNKRRKKAKVCEHSQFVESDRYRRLWYCDVFDMSRKTILYYDDIVKTFKKLLDIDREKTTNLSGHKLTGYKEFMFMYGGEYLIGKGNWNTNFWVYDTFRERWERKSVIPYIRRHFQTCMVGSNLYVVGGVGPYRLLQRNMFWYDFKEDKWSPQVEISYADQQIKCCNFLNKLFILNVNNKCGYLFNESNHEWSELNIILNTAVIDGQLQYAIFSYKNNLYIKGKRLIEFIARDNKLIEVSVRNVTSTCCDHMEVVLCNNIVYTLYEYEYEDTTTYSLETYNMDTHEINFVFQEISKNEILNVDTDNEYIISSSLNLFSFQRYSLVEENILVNNCFEHIIP